ncbi:ROK family transcriptional regulator [Paenibacillus nasutitermitis]|uniref:Transcriptional regulator n=1 Tax=Paenibacillus nasutitermitis TaxID=1652958 RepID=A0A916ZDC7_9BACL|nr:ROK family transcriptional regulator [Paenibacillus nasutitermitis]GGD89760.1 transcriptional regulator [Paenibacillus nasutitermitis]
MRDLNKRIVLNTIRKEKEISRIQLCRIIGLKPPTVSNIINELLQDNLIVFCGKGPTSRNGGPSPDLYKLNSTSKHFIGIDVSVDGIQGLILNLDGEIVAKIFSEPDYTTQEEFANKLKSAIQTLMKNSKVDSSTIQGIGVGVSALIDANQGTIKGASRMRLLKGFRIADTIKSEFLIDTFVDNDINLLALGQDPSREDVNEAKNVLCLGIRSGIGLGIIIDGKLYRGSEGMSGNIECFENAESENSIVEKVKELVRRNPGSGLLNDLGVEQIQEIDIGKVYDALQKRNLQIMEIAKESCRKLGVMAGQLVQLFNPDCFMVSGRMFNDNHDLFEYLVGVSREFCNNLKYDTVEYRRLRLDDTSVAYCAAYRILHNFFAVQ